MTPRLPRWVPLFIGILAIVAAPHAFAANDPPKLIPTVLQPEETICEECTVIADSQRCKVIYDKFRSSMRSQYKTPWLITLADMPLSLSCDVCISTALTLRLLNLKENLLDDSAARPTLCKVAPQVIKQCEQDYAEAFNKLGALYPNGLSRFRTQVPTSCSPQKPSAAPNPPPLQAAQPPSMSLGRKVMLGVGIPLTVLGISLLVATIPVATTIAPGGKLTGCQYQGFDTPCTDPGPAIGLGFGGGALTAVGIGLIVGGARAAERGQTPALIVRTAP